MNPDLARLQPYPFERLAALKHGLEPPADLTHINLSIGEPKHPTPPFILDALKQSAAGLARYPTTRGDDALRVAIAHWLTRRYGLAAGQFDPARHVLPVNGTREALFAIAQCVVDRTRTEALVLMPNPFYQIYEGAALLAGATPHFLPSDPGCGGLPNFDAVPEAVWRRCQLLYVCSPDNPTGAVAGLEVWKALIARAQRYDFVIAADECYAEIYPHEERPPPGLLQAAAALGNDTYEHCLVFHSLSKRSNVPGLRSGFVAGDAALIRNFLGYRTYHGCAMSPVVQAASAAAWGDEAHVVDNRVRYRAKFAAVAEILAPVLPCPHPAGGFYLWPHTPVDDETFARRLFTQAHVSVLPGRYLSRGVQGVDPGAGHVRIALVAELQECIEAARRIAAVTAELLPAASGQTLRRC